MILTDRLKPAGSLAGGRYDVDLTPERAGWVHSGLRVVTLPAGGDPFQFDTGEYEMAVLPLSGSATVRCEGDEFALAGRTSVFERVTDFAYVPRDAPVTLASDRGGEFALCMARATRRLAPRYGPVEGVQVETRGAGPATRQVTNFLSPDVWGHADKLMCVELLTPDGNWSSYPPHKHDTSPECRVDNEEIYYFRIGRAGTTDYAPEGFGMHRNYAPAGDPGGPYELDTAVRDGDVFLIPRGYHGPCVAAPGYPMYYLNVLAGPGGERSMAFCDDPAHHWVRDEWEGMATDPALPHDERERSGCMTRTKIGVAVVGFGWMGQAHARSYIRIPTLFPERAYDPELVLVSDNVQARVDEAVDSFGFREGTTDWNEVVLHPDVDVVCVCAPNMLHEPVAVAAAKAGKHVFCEKPVGGTPIQTVRIEAASRDAGIITGVGYNYRWAPLVQYAKMLIDAGELGEITNYRGRFFSMYGADPMGLLSWRFMLDEAGHGVSTDILSHSIDLAHMLVGPISRVVGTGHTFITERPLPKAGGTHYDRGHPGDPTGAVENEDYFGCMVEFENGARGVFESSRSIMGPESQNVFEVYGTKGSLKWNLETMNELELYLASDSARGYTTVYAGDRYPYHGHFVPGDANAIGYEDMKVIEDYEYLSSVAAGRQHRPGFAEAIDYVSVQDALLRSWRSERWEDVERLAPR